MYYTKFKLENIFFSNLNPESKTGRPRPKLQRESGQSILESFDVRPSGDLATLLTRRGPEVGRAGWPVQHCQQLLEVVDESDESLFQVSIHSLCRQTYFVSRNSILIKSTKRESFRNVWFYEAWIPTIFLHFTTVIYHLVRRYVLCFCLIK